MFLGIMLLIAALLTLGFGYLIMPAWSLASSALPWTIFIGLILFSIAVTWASMHYEWESPPAVIMWCVTGFVLIAIVFSSFVFASPVWHSHLYKDAIEIKNIEDLYRDEVKEVEATTFLDDFEDITRSGSYSLLDLDTARRLGDRVLGSVPNASWYNVSDEYNLITYKGELYRISPLEYRDLFAYSKAKQTGIPGYVLVNVSNMEAKFIRTKQPIKVSPSGCFKQRLYRVLRTQYPSYVFDKSFMEIDEDGNPFWITAVLEPKAGPWGAYTAKGYVITNAYDGTSEYKSIEEEIPSWIDHIYSLEYMLDRAEWQLKYVHGWDLNNMANTDVHHTTWNYRTNANTEKGIPAFYGYNSIRGKNGHIYIYTGVTPANRTESNSGFLMIDCKTAEYFYYPISGAEESSAQDLVEGIIQQMGYQSTFPVMVNISGEPAYLMNLKDKSGLIQRYAIVNYQNYSQAVVGMTFNDTLASYLKLVGKDEEPVVEEVIPSFEKEGVITEQYQAVVDGTTLFFYMIDGDFYEAPITVNKEQVMYKPGTTVKIRYEEGNIKLITEITSK